jgi:hypothetical protein
MTVRNLVPRPDKSQAPAAGRFGIVAGQDCAPRSYRPAGCPSLEQFEARFLLADAKARPPRAA